MFEISSPLTLLSNRVFQAGIPIAECMNAKKEVFRALFLHLRNALCCPEKVELSQSVQQMLVIVSPPPLSCSPLIGKCGLWHLYFPCGEIYFPD